MKREQLKSFAAQAKQEFAAIAETNVRYFPACTRSNRLNVLVGKR